LVIAMPAEPRSVYGLLQGLLPPQSPSEAPLHRWLPWSGTLPSWRLAGLRSFAQVIFINNPLSGSLLLLAFLLSSPWLALLATLGTASAQLTSHLCHADGQLRRQGIHGFNGTLVGCAVAVLGDGRPHGTGLSALILVLAGGALTTLLMVLWQRGQQWMGPNRWLPPPLTLPFILVSWCLLALAGSPAETTPVIPWPAPSDSAGFVAIQALCSGLTASFGQVFLCADPRSGALVLLAVALASPLAALIGLLGALVAMAAALWLGAEPAAVALGLEGYNGLLVAIAISGIFFAPSRRSLLAGLIGAALVVPVAQLQMLLIPALPRLTLPFVLVTWLLQGVIRHGLPALIPVTFHAVLTPEEHRQRFLVARELLGEFRSRLRSVHQGSSSAISALPADLAASSAALFRRLDTDGDRRLSLEELRRALQDGGCADVLPQLQTVLQVMDRDGDGQFDAAEFGQLMLRLQRLQQGEQRLLLYLMPADANGDDRLDAPELQRLLQSIGQAPLTSAELALVFGVDGAPLTWRQFVDRLLLA
jgi:urea transporter